MRRSLGCFVLLFVVGCDPLWPLPDNSPKGEPILKPFGSPAELEQYFRSQAKNRYPGRGGADWLVWPLGGMVMPAVEDAAMSTPEGAPDYSTTNLQEPGVDESDVVKNDGQYLYVLTDDVLRILRVSPPDGLEQLGMVRFDYSGRDLYLYGDTVIALLREYPYAPGEIRPLNAPGDNGGTYSGPRTIVALVDTTDKAQPTVTRTFVFEGELVSSRRIDNKLHVILSAYPPVPPDTPPDEIDVIPLERWLPKYQVTLPDGSIQAGNVAEWDAFYRPNEPDGCGVTAIVTIDVANPAAGHTSVAVVADRGVIYASPNALYLTDTDYDEQANLRQTTAIHKFDLTGGSARYVASGSVSGRLLNQFSLGEYEGYLRVATTTDSFSNGQDGRSKNHVFVLGEQDDRLVIVGSITDIAPGEELYAARFLGPRGFLVTFEKIDPLFTLDLSDPTQPRLVGELKVPGYSDYIHPLGDNYLLTIGKDAEDAGGFSWHQGVQLSLFDVSNPAEPVLVDKVILGTRGTESEACYDHKAFNYFAARGLLAVPIWLVEGGSGGPEIGEHTFTGLYVFRVQTDQGFELLGRIATGSADECAYCWDWYAWTRSVFLGPAVYAVTAEGVRASPIDQVGQISASLAF